MTEPNNTLGTATNIGSIGIHPTSIFDFVGSTDTNDYWRFNLTSTSDINIGLTGLSADADVQLLDSSGAVIASSFRGGTNSEDINLNNRAAGTYFVRVYQFSGNTNYTLRLSTADASNILAPQENLGPLSTTPITRTGSINNNNTSDIYQFSLSGTSDINIGLTGLTADIDLRFIRDANNNGIVDASDETISSVRGGTNSEDINLNNRAAGTYFAQVYQFGNSSSNYTLRLSNADPSNILAPQENFGTLVGSRTRSDFVGNTDTSDFYRFSVFGTRRLSATLSGLSADADLRLIRDGNGDGIVQTTEIIGSSTNGGTAPDRLNLLLGSGDYYLQVYQFTGNTNYNLGVTVS